MNFFNHSCVYFQKEKIVVLTINIVEFDTNLFMKLINTAKLASMDKWLSHLVDIFSK